MKKSFPAEVYLNGHWVSAQEATVSVFDRGFIFGDGIYEVTPYYKGKPYLANLHLERLERGLRETQIDLDISDLQNTMNEAITRAGLLDNDAAVYVQISRGVAPRGHAFPENTTPTILLYAFPVVLDGFEHKVAAVMVSKDIRWHRCDIKSTSLMANVRANNDAYTAGLQENIMLRNEVFTEGSHTNVFFVKNGAVYTHPADTHILPGITRIAVLELCKTLGIPVLEEALHFDLLKEVDEIFLTGTTTQILTVGKLVRDNETVYVQEAAGPITRKLQTAFIQQTRSV